MTGLSIPTLRHYDDIGLLRPADVDPRTSYRHYSEAQVGTTRRIRLLREAEYTMIMHFDAERQFGLFSEFVVYFVGSPARSTLLRNAKIAARTGESRWC